MVILRTGKLVLWWRRRTMVLAVVLVIIPRGSMCISMMGSAT
jgi:hypothetical protein